MKEQLSNIDAAIEAGRSLGVLSANIIHAGKASFIVVPDDYRLSDITQAIRDANPDPERIVASPTFGDVQSFVDYVLRFKAAGSLLFADRSNNRIVAVLDYHDVGNPSRATHRATLALNVSDEWIAWERLNACKMEQQPFLEWIEDHAAEIKDPQAARLQEICESLELCREVSFGSRVTLQDGTRKFVYEEKESAKQGSIAVPARFTLELRHYIGQAPQQVTARLRYEIPGGKLKFSFHIDRMEQTKEVCFEAVRQQIQTASGIQVLIGTP